MTFVCEKSKNLYEFIIQVNKDIIEDPKQKSLNIFNISNEATLITTCNSLYSNKPFSDEPFCNDFFEVIAYLIFYLNKGHCFSDGNKRTILITVMKMTEITIPELAIDYLSSALKEFLVEMLDKNLEKDKVLKWVIKQYNIRFNISDIEDDILKLGVLYKRNENYDKAISIYMGIINEYGPSIVLYEALGKVHACKKEYKKAISFFEKSNELTKKSFHFENLNAIYHIENLKKRDSSNFLNYMKQISGNPNYK